MEQYRKMLDMFDDGDAQMKLQTFSSKLLNRDATYTAYKESFYRILDGLKKDGINVCGINDAVTGHTIEDCLYMMCKNHEGIGFSCGISLGTFISPTNKKVRKTLGLLLQKLIHEGVIKYGPREMFTIELESQPASSISNDPSPV